MNDECHALDRPSFIVHPSSLVSYSPPVTSSPAPGGQLPNIKPNAPPRTTPKIVARRYCLVVVASNTNTIVMNTAPPITLYKRGICLRGARAGLAAAAAGAAARGAAGAAAGALRLAVVAVAAGAALL